MNFSAFNLDPAIAAGVEALGYSTPTPIQHQAIPPILAGRDVIGLAQTGTGKTAAFALPILQRLVRGPRGRARALVLAPTRELAEQIHTVFSDLGRRTRLRSTTVYGGVSAALQARQLREGAEIVVACPGRLLDHLGQGTADLRGIEVLVLDEADRMFDMGFLPDVRRVLARLPARRQTLLFSATMPDAIGKLAREILHAPVTVQVAHTEPLNSVAHALYPVPAHLKTAMLLALLAQTDTESVLVFTRTKHRAKRLAVQLKAAGYRAAALQGNLSQNQRQAAMSGFRDGKHQILVATDIAARGLDVSLISHVINYDMPDTTDAYTHRIGRTGRAAKTGDAFTLVTPEDDDMVRAIERVLGRRLERRKLAGFDYAVADTRPTVAPPRQRQGGAQDNRAPHAPPQRPEQRQPGPSGRTAPARPAARRKPARPGQNGPRATSAQPHRPKTNAARSGR